MWPWSYQSAGMLLTGRVDGVTQTLPFFCISAWISHLVLSCLTIDQNSFIYQPMRATYSHSVQKDHPTAEGIKKGSRGEVIVIQHIHV